MKYSIQPIPMCFCIIYLTLNWRPTFEVGHGTDKWVRMYFGEILDDSVIRPRPPTPQWTTSVVRPGNTMTMVVMSDAHVG